MEKYKLTNPQQNIWDLSKQYPDTAISYIAGQAIIKNTKFDYNLFNETINQMIKENDSLRTKIYEIDNTPYQSFERYQKEDIEFLDFSNIDDEKKLNNILNEMARMKLPDDSLTDFKIIKYSNDQFGFYWKLSHLIADGFSAGLVGQHLIKDYSKRLKNEAIDDEIKPSYQLLINREKEYKESNKYSKDKAAYSEEYVELPPLIKTALNDSENINANRYSVNLENDKTSIIRDFCKTNNIPEAVFFESIILSYLSRTTGENNITIGSPVLNRTNSKERNVMGMFVSTNPFQIKINDTDNYNDVVTNIKKQKMAMFRRQAYPFSDLQNDIYDKHQYSGKLFDIAVSYQNAKVFESDDLPKLDLTTEWYFTGVQNNELVINIDDRDDSGLKINIDYKTELYKEPEIANLMDRFTNIMDQVIENPQIKINELELLTINDINRYKALNILTDIPITESLINIFEKHAKEKPNSPALQFEDKVFTYSELNNMANLIAEEISKSDITNDDIIPIIGNRSFYTIASLLAVRKLGKAYFIIDDTLYPKERIDYLMEEVYATKFVSYGSEYNKVNTKKININNNTINWNKQAENIENSKNYNKDETFCVIHTSGSTGKPKVVEITDAGVVNMAYNNKELIQNCDTLVSFMIMSFDAFLMDTMMALGNGKKLVLTNEEEVTSISSAEKILKREQNSFVILTPTRMKQNLEACQDNSWHNAKTIILGGEKIDSTLVDLINEKCPNATAFNLYGPTETTVFNTKKQITNKEVTIGKPTQNFAVYLVDKNNKVLPPGTLGEIAVIGDGVAKGYYRRPEITKKQFFLDQKTGKRMYKTGDYAYLTPENELFFIGRMDNQIKINGLRIEIEEIEKELRTHPNILLSGVKVQQHQAEKFLVGYYQLKENTKLSETEIKHHLEKVLPSYMVPPIFVEMDKIPLTSSGKLDRKSIPDVNLEAYLENSYVEANTDLQNELVNIWEEVLKRKKIGVETPFAALGGTSKVLIDMIIKIERKLSKQLSPADFSKNPTIKDMEEVLNGNKNLKDINIMNYDINSIECLPKNNKTSVLITGANGFLGAHILDYTLNNTNSNIYCLVRNPKKLKEATNFYFDNSKYLENPRIKIICGDIAKEKLGLNKEVYEELEQNLGTVYNCAANVSHFTSVEEAKTVNVDGVYNLLKLTSPIGASMEHMSTITVSGINVSEQKGEGIIFSEDSLDVGQDYTHDAYMLTKYKAEQLVRNFQEKGATCSIYRTGYISERSYDQKFQINSDTSAFKMIVEKIKEIGIVPEAAQHVKIQSAPVDKLAEAVVRLSNADDRLSTYHLYDPNTEYLCDYLDDKNIEYQMITNDDFTELSNQLVTNSEKESDSVVYKYLKGFMENPTTNKIENSNTMEKLNETNFKYK